MTTYTKLKDDEWGIKTDFPVKVGDRLIVTKKDGTTTLETVADVLWKYDRIAPK